MTNLTPQQQSFIATASDTDSVALRARAGTGKTFSLRQWASSSRKGGIATSFSKSTVQELTKKLSSRFPAKTLHALGRSAIKSSGKLGTLDSSKVFNIVNDLVKEHELDYESAQHIRSLATIAKTYGIQPDASGPPGLTPDEPEVWEYFADQFDLDLSDLHLDLARQTIILSNKAAVKDGLIDFDDMLYIPLIYPHRFPRYPVILADEVQDFNMLQHTMLKRCLLPSGRIIAAGDDRQAIYAFRGALSDSYHSLVKTFKMRELPLTVSFRCPREVILEAQKYVPDIEPAPSAIQGSILRPDSITSDELPRTILCRNNAPLITLALHLLVEGHSAEVAGKDIGKGLIALTKRITKKNLSTPEFLDRLSKWKEREIARYPKRKARITDKFQALSVLAGYHKDLVAIQKHLEKLYPDPSSKSYRPSEFHLTTIHRAKGREWPRVGFLDPHLLPSKYATQEWEKLQESNLAYVGITRAQEELVYVNSKAIEGLSDEK